MSKSDPRERILEAAATTFAALGHDKTRVEDIAAEAKMSRRTIYEHFRDIGALRHAVYERALQATLLRVGALAQDPTLADPMYAVLTELFTVAKRERKLGQLILHEIRRSDGAALREQIVAFFVGVLMEEVKRDYGLGLVPREPDEVTVRAIVGAAEALAVWMVEADPDVEVHDAVRAILRLWRRVMPWGRP